MPPEGWSAVRAVADASIRSFSGTAWRVHWREIGPTDWRLSLRSSGRYHRGLDLFPADQAFPALYTSLSQENAIWEMVRRSAARNLAYLKNNVLSELVVDLGRVLDLSDPSAVGLVLADLTSSDLQLCQELAAAAMALRAEGMLVPSAALPGLNLVILPQNLLEPPSLQILRSTELPLETIAGERPEGGQS
ncbi:MAG: RES domain-containing protein [Dehalococcoidia bacterium]|nr:RES domain-containing protein [Dehalococcoidia bacterium]